MKIIMISGKKGAIDILSNIIAISAIVIITIIGMMLFQGCSPVTRTYFTRDSYASILEVNTEQVLMRENEFHIYIPSEKNEENEEIEIRLSIADAISLWAQYDLLIKDYDSEDRKEKREVEDAKDSLGEEILNAISEELNKISSIQWIYASIFDAEDDDVKIIESSLNEIAIEGDIKVITKEIPLFADGGVAYFGVAYFDYPPKEEYGYE